ncbi:MAG: 6-phosphofructokinase [Chryseolinea sp.]
MKVVRVLQNVIQAGKGFANIVIAEGAHALASSLTSAEGDKGSEHVSLGGVAYELSRQLKAAGCTADISETVLGHVQRGGSPMAYDRVLATLFGVKAFEMVLNHEFGRMVAFRNNHVTSVTLDEATQDYNGVNQIPIW